MLDRQRTEELLGEACEDLSRYDDLRANTLEWIKTLERRLRLLGAESSLLLPGVEGIHLNTKNGKRISNGSTKSNKEHFLDALAASGQPLNPREVWAFAARAGARSQSTRPERMTDALLREMVKAGQIIKAAPGRYQAKGPGMKP